MDKWDAYAVKETAQNKLKSAMEAAKKSLQEGRKVARQEGMKEGMKKGLEEGKAEVVRNLIGKFGFNDEQAADAAGVSIGFVRKIRAALKKKK